MVAKAVLGGVVDPLFDPDLFLLRLFHFFSFVLGWGSHRAALACEAGVGRLTGGESTGACVQANHSLALGA